MWAYLPMSLVHDGESNGNGNERRVAKKRKLAAGTNGTTTDCSSIASGPGSNDNSEATSAPRQKLRGVVRSLSAKWRVQKRRLLDAGTPIEDHKTALIKLRMANVTGEGGGNITGFYPWPRPCFHLLAPLFKNNDVRMTCQHFCLTTNARI